MPFEPSQQFGRYRIVKKLGEGGMGAVYEAEDMVLGRRVALKVPRFDPDDDIKVIERFHREARIAAAIHHPNLCPVFDVGEVDGTHFLTMPLLDGTPLSRRQNPDRLWPERRAAELVRKVALAVQLMHHKGVMHRDLKPSNIMLQDGGEPVILDFGLARSYSGDDRLTTTDRPVGTPAYMSPEQIAGDPQEMGPGCDIYGLGVILYELLAGRLPFVGPWSALFGQILHVEPPPPSSFRAGLGPALEAICLRAMAKKARNRYASMADFAAALDSYLQPDARPREDDRREVTDNACTLPEPPPAASGLRFDGLYQCGDEAVESRSFLRFLEDGRVFGASSISTAPQVARWLGTHHWDDCGIYQVDGDTIEFEEDGAFTTIRYRGRILPDGLRLEVNSRTSSYRSENAYRFVPLDVPPVPRERWPADTVSDHEFASLCARQPARADPGVELRYDGLHQNGGHFLRFYPGGRVAGASTFDDPTTVASWLGNSAAESRGRYRLREASIAFELDGIMATVKYAGHLRRDGLELEVHSLKNGHRSTVRYSFQPIDFAAAAFGAKLSPKVLKSEDDPGGNTMSLLVDDFDMAFVGTAPFRPRAQPAAPPRSGGGSGRDWSLYDLLAGERLSLASVPRGKREGHARSVFQELETRLRGRFSEQQGYGFVATKSDSLARDLFHIYIRKEEGWEFSVFLRPSDNNLNELVVHRTHPWGEQVKIALKTGFGGMVLVLMILFGTGWYNRGFVDWSAFLGQALTWSLPAFFGCLLLRVAIFWLLLRPGIKRDEADIDRIIADAVREATANLAEQSPM